MLLYAISQPSLLVTSLLPARLSQVATDNLYLAFLEALPSKTSSTDFCFGITKVGVEMDCSMKEMYSELGEADKEKLWAAGILDDLEYGGVEQETTIHCGNTRVVGLEWPTGRKVRGGQERSDSNALSKSIQLTIFNSSLISLPLAYNRIGTQELGIY